MVFLNLGLTAVLLIVSFFRPPCSHAASPPNPGQRPFLSPSPESSNEATSQHGLEEGWVYLLDWDNTLFPTAWWSSKKGNDKIEKDDPDWDVLSGILKLRLEILQFLQDRGETYIVSNANDNWLKESRELWHGGIGPLPEDRVISARDRYYLRHHRGNNYKMDAKKWKPYVFDKIVRGLLLLKKVVTHVVVVGDQVGDHEAGDALVGTYKHDGFKVIKTPLMDGGKSSLEGFKKELEELLKYLKDQRGEISH